MLERNASHTLHEERLGQGDSDMFLRWVYRGRIAGLLFVIATAAPATRAGRAGQPAEPVHRRKYLYHE